MKTVFLGTSKFVIPIINVLNNNYNLELVITTEKSEDQPVIKFCKNNNIPYFTASNKENLKSIFNNLKTQNNYDLGIVADFGIIIPENILKLFNHGVINIHPSLLPKYRGSTPIQTAILNDDKETGLSFIKMDKEMDHGPILLQVKEKIKDNDTFESLCYRLFLIASEALKDSITNFITNNIQIPQDHSKATYTQVLNRDSGYIKIDKNLDIKSMDRKTRALYPWPGVWTKTIINPDTNEKIIKFKPNKIIQVEGKKEMSYKDFLNGYPNAENNLLNFIKQDA